MTKPDGRLFVFEPAAGDVLPIPEAGEGLNNPTFLDGESRIAFDQDGRIYVLDLRTRRKWTVPVAAGIPVSDPGFAKDDQVMVSHSRSDVYLWFRNNAIPPLPATGSPPPEASSPDAGASPAQLTSLFSRASPTPQDSPSPPSPPGQASPVVALTELHALASDHGGIATAKIDGAAKLVVVSMNDGTLWVLALRTRALRRLVIPEAVSPGVDDFSFQSAGDLIVFESAGRLFLYSLATGMVDPLPEVNQAFDPVRVFSPSWHNDRGFYYRWLGSDGRVRLARFDVPSGRVRSATLLNGVLGQGGFAPP